MEIFIDTGQIADLFFYFSNYPEDYLLFGCSEEKLKVERFYLGFLYWGVAR